MKFLGIDYGTKRVGVAMSDDGGTIAFPHAALANDKNLVRNILTLCFENKVGAVVVGDPAAYFGIENPIRRDALRFKDALSREAELPVFFEPEHLTSAEARRTPHKAARSRKQKERRKVDAEAAALILRSFIDKRGSP